MHLVELWGLLVPTDRRERRLFEEALRRLLPSTRIPVIVEPRGRVGSRLSGVIKVRGISISSEVGAKHRHFVQCVNEDLLREGAARRDPAQPEPGYAEAEEEARKMRVGLWQGE